MYQSESGWYELYKADTGAIRFKVRYPMGMGFAVFTLTSKDNPEKDLYQIFFGPTFRFLDVTRQDFGEQEFRRFHIPEPIGEEFREFWLTWHSGSICLGVDRNPDPVLAYSNKSITQYNIGFIKFYTKSVRWPIEWEFEASPVILKPIKEVKFDGDLEWKTNTTEVNENNVTISSLMPEDAFIGGFENEPIYIARAPLNGSLCVGKYIPSKCCAYLPWGGREFTRVRCQVLCGFNAKWVKTKGSRIPGNALVAGYSEVRQEPLYVGRAMYDNCLLVGKVHALYSTCYLPYHGKEVEVYEYEILVTMDQSRGVFAEPDTRREGRPPPPQLVL